MQNEVVQNFDNIRRRHSVALKPMKDEKMCEQIKELEIIEKKIDERETYLRLLRARRKLEAIEKEIDAISTTEEKSEDAANTEENKEKKEDREVDDLGDIRSVSHVNRKCLDPPLPDKTSFQCPCVVR